jgi:AcrR family transcriptional regulator
MSGQDQAKDGLRERKKRKTKSAIQRHAMQLFREQGYRETTIEQIAEAAEVSPSTLFRYFPTKESLVLDDDYDPLLVEAYRSQPPELTPIQAFRQAVRQSSVHIPEEERDALRERMKLIMTVPELRGAMLLQVSSTLDLIATLVGERLQKDKGELSVLVYAGALMSTALTSQVYSMSQENADFMETLDAALDHLENDITK